MYSRQGIHPQRVTGIPHGTPDPPARPFAPSSGARAPMSDRASRYRVARCGHDTRQTAHCARGAARALLTRLRWLSHTTHNAHSNLLQMHMHAAVLARSLTRALVLARRSERSAARSAAAGPSGSRQTHSLIDLRKGGGERGARATPTCAPLPPTWWTWQWSR